MRFADLTRSATAALWRQKARTALTLSGILVGTTALVISVSLGLGLRSLTQNEYFKNDGFWYVTVHPGRLNIPTEEIPAEALKLPDNISPERAERLRDGLIKQYRNSHPPKAKLTLTPERIDWLRTIPDVETVYTARLDQALVTLAPLSKHLSIYAGQLEPLDLPSRLLFGQMPANASTPEVLISEKALFQLGLFSDAQLKAALGQMVTIKLNNPGNPATQDPALGLGTFRIVGILRTANELEVKKIHHFTNWWEAPDVYLPATSGEALFQTVPRYRNEGHASVVVKINPGGDIENFVDTIKTEGYSENSAVEWLRHTRTEVTLISIGLNVFALLALAVAAIGITNTMVTGVIERTREIGVLKAVGARDGQILALFLAEGGTVGLMGGTFGLILAKLISIPLNSLVLHLVEKQARNKLFTTDVFLFPLWLIVGTIVLIVTVTVLAALYPALRAARIRPVDAVRHE